ncbi:type II toxin-antitoxin system RelE/ParE family toxin [Candidatus Sororendozoicomonas aggregata]|uniref:type II toxin-antitoxin system RelE family toxin n=1 Tax=Candidatus Sororendozoicomonas aggregata TaxID=3073239 RepID=UPI002ED174AA
MTSSITYTLQFNGKSAKEFSQTDRALKLQFQKKLKERLVNPHVPKSRLHDMKDCYKIKLKSSGIRLVYRVDDQAKTVTVLAVGERARSTVYKNAKKRLL